MKQFNHIAPYSYVLLTLLFSGYSLASENAPPSLQGVAVPATTGLIDGLDPIIQNKTAAIQLGKALFWDSAVGSDGMACASCHFHAGADRRVQNQLSTGASSKKPSGKTFQPTGSGATGGINYTLKLNDFPLYKLADVTDKNSAVLFDTDDVVSSAGVFTRKFIKTSAAGSDTCSDLKNTTFHLGSLSTRQVQGRQSPSVINAAFNFRNFWDGRANNIFNGSTPFGVRDNNAGVWVTQTDGTTQKQTVRLENASLASQAVGPTLSATEMSCAQRSFPDVGRKLLTRKPLANQAVHAEDSVLAALRDPSGIGLNTTYQDLIKAAFAPRYWAGFGNFGSPKAAQTKPYNQAEANFSFFFGLALQLYQQTLISDQTPYDTPRIPNLYPEVPTGLNEQQRRGLGIFLNAQCVACHKGPTFSTAAHPSLFNANNHASLDLVNRKLLNGQTLVQSLIDEGYFNLSVTPDERDLGVGGTDPFGNPLSFSQQYINQLLTGKALIDPIAVNSCDFDNPFFIGFANKELSVDPYITGSCGNRSAYAQIPKTSVLQKEWRKNNHGRAALAVTGAFKVPTLRNVELTGPYMHNGSLLTLEEVVDFYFRGGNFNNPEHFSVLVNPQANRWTAQDKADLVAFLKSLTDERVRWERAPFDHPQLAIPHGHDTLPATANHKEASDLFLVLPAVGQKGRSADLGPLQAFENYLAP